MFILGPLTLLLTYQMSLLLPLPSTNSENATSYLQKFGYLSNSASPSATSSRLQSLEDALKKLQDFAGLEQTGVVDGKTEELMNMRRCGVKDSLTQKDGVSRMKRYALQGSRWKTRTLTYKVSKYPSRRLSKRIVDKTIKKAFEVWSKDTNFRFIHKPAGTVQLDIRFEKRSHGDEDDFDGRGGTLAHAFFPIYGGDIHFDDDEDWTVNSIRGTSLMMSAAHELGHSLGLAHSNVKGSLMSPFYISYKADLKLHSDDIKGIEAIYGTSDNILKESVRTPLNTRTIFTPSTNAPSATPSSFICKGYIDTIVTTSMGITYAFLGGKYWKLSDTAIEPGYPRLISDGWKGLPWNIDAAFTWTNGKTYFFKGAKYWRFKANGDMDTGYPKQMSEGFAGIPSNVDAAFVWPVNNKIYFFKNSLYWKFDPDSSPSVDSSYPRPISNWDGIPSKVESVMQYSNGKTYFFKTGQYYRFDDIALTVDEDADPPYPRDTGYWWFGCK